MSQSFGKMAPTLVMIMAVGYFCWPYISSDFASRTGSREKQLPEIKQALLNPAIVPSRGRDPFGDKSARHVRTEKRESPNSTKQRAEEAPTDQPPGDSAQIAKNEAEDEDLMSQAESDPEDHEAAKPVVLDPYEEEIKLLKANLKLNATLLGPSNRVAIINSQSYAEGEVLPETPLIPKAWLVSKVTRHSIFLQKNSKRFELNYDNNPTIPGDLKNHSAMKETEGTLRKTESTLQRQIVPDRDT